MLSGTEIVLVRTTYWSLLSTRFGSAMVTVSLSAADEIARYLPTYLSRRTRRSTVSRRDAHYGGGPARRTGFLATPLHVLFQRAGLACAPLERIGARVDIAPIYVTESSLLRSMLIILLGNYLVYIDAGFAILQSE